MATLSPEDDLTGFAAKCIQDWSIRGNETIVGFSFGGQVAMESPASFPYKIQQSRGMDVFIIWSFNT